MGKKKSSIICITWIDVGAFFAGIKQFRQPRKMKDRIDEDDSLRSSPRLQA
jgi:hypothetical protein